MKKFFLMAFAALSMSAMAQSVTPLSITLAEFKVDSLRSLYMSEPIMYRAALDNVSKALAKNADEIKAAKSVLKVEQQHAKEMTNGMKEASSLAASLKKLYAKEEQELKSMQKAVEKQQKTLGKQSELTQDTREAYTVFLDKQQKELGYALREVAERARAVAELETQINTRQSQMQAYEQQVSQKTAEITMLEKQLKERQNSVKSEQKAAKSMQ